MPSARGHRRSLFLIAGLAVLLVIALPAFAADPSPAPTGAEQRPEKPDKAGKAAKGPELSRTLHGTVERATDDKGRPAFTMTVDGTTWELSAGPKWFHGDRNPLAPYVGRSVDVAGTHHQGESELDVATVDGKPIRAAGKPPWAGGPWVVGEAHPGWKGWMADGKPGRGHGRDDAPGQNRDEAGADEGG